jgi:hypothetical protein
MAKCIVAAIRQLDQLHGSLLLTAQELAHRADGFSGEVTVSYQYLAWKCHTSRRTAIRHIAKLFALGILRVQRFYQAGHRWSANKYKFCLAWEYPPRRQDPDRQQAFGRVPGTHTAHKGNGDTMTPILPPPEKEKSKWGSWEAEKAAPAKVISWLSDPQGALARLLRGER